MFTVPSWMIVSNLVRVPIAIDALARWAGERGWVRQRGRGVAFDEGRALHHLVDEVLGPRSLRPFRLLVPHGRNSGNLYAYSLLDAEALRTSARTHALPDHLRVLSLDQFESKPMPNVWRVGQQLGFDLRVRPVRRLGRDLDTSSGMLGKGAEIDAFLLETLRRHPVEPGGMEKDNRTREAVYLDWLAERLAPAATLDRPASRLAHFRRFRVARGGDRGPEGPDATVHGTLMVTDPTAFAALLPHGVGRHRAYGYGMLLLRPPNRPALEF